MTERGYNSQSKRKRREKGRTLQEGNSRINAMRMTKLKKKKKRKKKKIVMHALRFMRLSFIVHTNFYFFFSFFFFFFAAVVVVLLSDVVLPNAGARGISVPRTFSKCGGEMETEKNTK